MAPMKDTEAAKPLKPVASGVKKDRPRTQSKLQKEQLQKSRKDDLERHREKVIKTQQQVDSMDTSEDSRSQIMEELERMKASENSMKEEIAQLDEELMDIDGQTDKNEPQGSNVDPFDPNDVQQSIEGDDFAQSKPLESDSFFDGEEPEVLSDFASLRIKENDWNGIIDLLGEGKTLYETKGFRGRLYFKCYGPRSRPMLTWTSSCGLKTAENVPFLHTVRGTVPWMKLWKRRGVVSMFISVR